MLTIYGLYPWGMTAEPPIFTICNARGSWAKLSRLGAALLELHVPDSQGKLGNVVSSHPDHRFAGVTVGRVANRIRGARFELGGKSYELTPNEGSHQLHGGSKGPLDQLLWKGKGDSSSVSFRVMSPHGTDGFPGNLEICATYALTDDDELVMKYSVTTDRPTPVNLTNHTYWNLGGTLESHELMICAQEYAPTDSDLIPTGALESVQNSMHNFLHMRPVGSAKYDHTFALDSGSPAAVLWHPGSGRKMEVHTTQAALQLFTTEHALCLEAQAFPDAVNQPRFPSVVLNPADAYTQTTRHCFSRV